MAISELNSRFSVAPADVSIQRSRFVIPFNHKTTFNAGDLVPLFCKEILPGDTVSLDLSSVVRMTTPLFPVMDNAKMDYWIFFVPNRLVWEHWREFCGENTTTAWEQQTEYQIPQINAPEGGWQKGTIADFLGIPPGVSGFSVSALPFRGYCLIWNEWFRDQNLKDPCMINLDDATQTGANDGDYVANAQLGALPLKVAKPHDYFTSCLPEPQKGPDVLLPLGQYAPVVTSNILGRQTSGVPLTWNINKTAGVTVGVFGTADGSSTSVFKGSSPDFEQSVQIYPDNLVAKLSEATSSTVNQLRQAFAVQRFYERLARGGSRYTEIVRSMFGVTSPDARQQRPEYLGGFSTPINVDQVLQTSATSDVSPQGNTGAYSLTNSLQSVFTHSFTEHGYIFCLAAVRTMHTYQQGLERHWSRKGKFDFYWPPLANLGEQPVLNKEIYLQGSKAAEDDQVFGYQEAWADYRYMPDRISGELRSTYAQPLDAWHYADYYESLPHLSSDWIDETKNNIQRTLAVDGQDQFIGDFAFRMIFVRPMPLYSIPGMIDHF